MAIVAGDWTIDRSTGDIRYTGNTHVSGTGSYATVIEFHRWLQELADDAVSTPASSDELDITDLNPSDRSTDNIITLLGNYNLDQASAEHLYDGSIIQGSGATETIWDGIVNYGNSDILIQIIQDGAVIVDDWWNDNGGAGAGGVNPDAGQGISHRFMVKVREFGADIDGRKLLGTNRRFGKTYGEFFINGTSRGNNVLALTDADDLNNATAEGTVAGWTGITASHGYVGIDVDNDTISEFYSDQWDANLPTRSINDFYERMKYLTRDGTAETVHAVNGELYRGITHEVSYDTLSNGPFVEDGLAVWGTNIQWDTPLTSAGTVGEYYTFSGGAVGKLLALDDDTTTGNAIFMMETSAPGYSAPVDGETFVRSDGTANDGATVDTTVTDGTSAGGYGLIIADDGVDDMWIQLLVGSAPADNLPIWGATLAGVFDQDAGVNALTNTAPVARTISSPFIGASTGSAIIGAYGVGIQTDDLTNNDKLFDLTNTQRTPPNNVTFTVSGLVVGEDEILVGPWDGVSTDINGDPAIDEDQLTLNGALTTADVATITVTSIPSDTPSSGHIRVQDDNGFWRRIAYTGISGNSFTGCSDPSNPANTGQNDFDVVGAADANLVYVSYLDQEATATSHNFTFVYSADRNFVVKARDGKASPIKEFIGTGTMSNTGGSITIIRTTDE